MANTRRRGEMAEAFVADVLCSRGFEILERNYSLRFAEVDIIAFRDTCVHFVEVKARNGNDCGYPAEAVTAQKQRRIRKLAEVYLDSMNMCGFDVSFDVAELEFNYIENCF